MVHDIPAPWLCSAFSVQTPYIDTSGAFSEGTGIVERAELHRRFTGRRKKQLQPCSIGLNSVSHGFMFAGNFHSPAVTVADNTKPHQIPVAADRCCHWRNAAASTTSGLPDLAYCLAGSPAYQPSARAEDGCMCPAHCPIILPDLFAIKHACRFS